MRGGDGRVAVCWVGVINSVNKAAPGRPSITQPPALATLRVSNYPESLPPAENPTAIHQPSSPALQRGARWVAGGGRRQQATKAASGSE